MLISASILLILASLLTAIGGMALMLAANAVRDIPDGDIQYRVTYRDAENKQHRHYFDDLLPAQEYRHTVTGSQLESHHRGEWKVYQ